MSTFKFKKDISEIEDPVLLEEGWYLTRISKPPEIAQNKDKTGENLVIRVRTIVEEDDTASNRMLTMWLPMPKDEDEEEYDGRGQKISDAKMNRIAEFVEKFGGDVEGDEFVINEGMRGFVYVVQQLDQAGNDLVNGINSFSGFRSEEEGMPGDTFGEDETEAE